MQKLRSGSRYRANKMSLLQTARFDFDFQQRIFHAYANGQSIRSHIQGGVAKRDY